MLTGNLVRVRHARTRIIPYYLDADDPTWLGAAGRLLDLFRGREGTTRGELEEELADAFGDEHGQLVFRGLAKLLEDRCEFEVVSEHPPDELREAVFRAAAEWRKRDQALPPPEVSAEQPTALLTPSFDRALVLQSVAQQLGLTAEIVDSGLFADLKSEQRLIRFKDTTPERLLQRYNVALAQAVLLRSRSVQICFRHETPQRYRLLLRMIKFHRLICEVTRTAPDCYQFRLDGPLSLFSATNKYGLQLALFLPTVLLCRDFELHADLLWGPQRRPKTFVLASAEGLVSHAAESGTYVPTELTMFVDLFRKRVEGWEITEESDIFPLGNGFWVPDYRLTHSATGQIVYLEVLGFWRRSSAEAHLRRLRDHITQPFLLAVSDSLHIEEGELEGLAAEVHRFRQMPLPDEVARLAAKLLTGPGSD